MSGFPAGTPGFASYVIRVAQWTASGLRCTLEGERGIKATAAGGHGTGWSRPLAAVAVVCLPAEIDLSNAAQARDLIADAAATGAGVIVADMTGTTFCDSTGIGMLIAAHKRAAAAGVALRVAVISRPVLRVMAITGADQVLAVHDSVDAALG